MSTDYIKKVNDIPLAASEAVPSSEIDVKLKDLKNRWNDNHGNMRTSSTTSAVWAKLATLAYPSGLDGENAIYGKIVLHQYTTTKLAADFSFLFPSGALAICKGNFTSNNIDNIKIGFVVDSTNRMVDLYGYISGYAYSGIRLIIDDITRYHGATVDAAVQYYKDATLLSSEPSGIVYCDNDNGAVQTNVADYLKYQHTNEINYKNVPTSGNKSRHWFNYRNGDTDAADSSNKITDYYFGNRNNSVDGVYLHAEGCSSKIIKGPSGTSGKNYTTVIKFVDGSNTADGFLALRCVYSRALNTGSCGFVDIIIKRRSGTYWYAAFKSARTSDFGKIEPESNTGKASCWNNGSTHYIGITTSSYTTPVAVFVQYCELNSAFTYELGDFVSEVSSIVAEEVDTRDLCAGMYLKTTDNASGYLTYKFFPSSSTDVGSGSPAPQVQYYWENMPKNTGVTGPHGELVYNSAGVEYSLFFHKNYDSVNNKIYGNVIRWGYQFPYLEMMRYHPTTGWKSSEWEPLSSPTVLTLEYIDTTAGKEALYNTLLAYRTMNIGSGSNTIRHPIVFLYKDDNYYTLSYRGAGGGQGGGSATWQFSRVVGSNVDRVSFTASWDTGGNYTYSWGSGSGLVGDVTPKHLKTIYYSSDGNQTIDISADNRHYEVQLNSYASSVTIDLDCSLSSTCTTVIKLVDKITAAQCGGLYIRWRDECGAYHRYFFGHMSSSASDPVGLQVSIKKVTFPVCGSPTYAIARVTLIPGEYNS